MLKNKFLNIISRYKNNHYEKQLKTFNNFKCKYYDTIFVEEINEKEIKKINKYKYIKIYPKTNFILSKKLTTKIVYWIDHPFGLKFQSHMKNLKIQSQSKKIYIQTFKYFKNLVFNYIPWRPLEKLKYKKINFKKKKYDILFLSGKSKLDYQNIIINPFLIYISFKYSNYTGNYFDKIRKNTFDYFLYKISIGNNWQKYHIIWQLIRHIRRKKIKTYLEKINKKIVYVGSKQFMPNNTFKYFEWLTGERLKKILSTTKIIIVTDSVCHCPNERFFFMKYGILTFFDGFEDQNKFIFNNNQIFEYKVDEFKKKIEFCLKNLCNPEKTNKIYKNFISKYNYLYFKKNIFKN